jgi:hypothetical protein
MALPPAVKEQMAKQRRATFIEWARDPALWLNSSETNRYIAGILYERYIKAHKDYVALMEASVKPGHKRAPAPNEIHSNMVLGKSTLMHYGLALECGLKACAIKQGLDPVQDASADNPSLKREFAHHDLARHIEQIFGDKPPVLSPKQPKYLFDLTRAINSGKYPVEKDAEEEWAYTAELDEKVAFVEEFIKHLKAI